MKIFLVFLLWFLPACGPSPTQEIEARVQADEARHLRLQAREQEIHRLSAHIDLDTTQRRAVINDDLTLLQERLMGVRLAWDGLRAADQTTRGQAEKEFDASLETLNQSIKEMKSRYP